MEWGRKGEALKGEKKIGVWVGKKNEFDKKFG